jgi:hypothetical protein
MLCWVHYEPAVCLLYLYMLLQNIQSSRALEPFVGPRLLFQFRKTGADKSWIYKENNKLRD